MKLIYINGEFSKGNAEEKIEVAEVNNIYY